MNIKFGKVLFTIPPTHTHIIQGNCRAKTRTCGTRKSAAFDGHVEAAHDFGNVNLRFGSITKERAAVNINFVRVRNGFEAVAWNCGVGCFGFAFATNPFDRHWLIFEAGIWNSPLIKIISNLSILVSLLLQVIVTVFMKLSATRVVFGPQMRIGRWPPERSVTQTNERGKEGFSLSMGYVRRLGLLSLRWFFFSCIKIVLL